MNRFLLPVVAVLWGGAAGAQELTDIWPARKSEAASVVVVFNNRDPLSVGLAGHYAEKRGIPFTHLIGLDCATAEEITREEYDRTIAEPLRKEFREHQWWRVSAGGPVIESKIRYLVLMRGVPLKIAQVSDYPGDSYEGLPELSANAAAVDSELSVLGQFARRISGPVNNPYYRSFTPFADFKNPTLLLVCRLDAATGDTVRRMIDDAIATEQHELPGFVYVDARGIDAGPMAEGDRWLMRLADDARAHGFPVILDRREEQFHHDYPMKNAALYFGWYGTHVAGPMARPDFAFLPGALACHIHSMSGASLRDPEHLWVAPLLARGAAATLGNVYEPYLALTPNLDLFFDRLRNGFNFAESAYASVRGLSWMTTFIGDPLYRPFRVVPEGPAKGAEEWRAYRDGALTWFRDGRVAGEAALQKAATQMRSGIIWESLGLLERDAAHDDGAALAAFEQAQKNYADANDVTRVAIHRVQTLQAAKRTKEAAALARKQIGKFPNLPASNAVRSILAEELEPKPSPTKSP